MNSSRSIAPQQGFTLIEILVVVFIIGLTAGMVALTVGDRKSETGAPKEAALLVQAVDFVSEYATLNGEVVALFIQPKEASDSLGKQWCYHWKRLREGGWTDLPEDTLDEHCMDESVQWDLTVEGHVWTYDEDLEVQPPVLVFSPSGESTEVEMAIFESGDADNTQRIEIDLMGTIHWLNQEEDEKRDGH